MRIRLSGFITCSANRCKPNRRSSGFWGKPRKWQSSSVPSDFLVLRAFAGRPPALDHRPVYRAQRLRPRSHTKAHEEIRECPVPGHPGLRPPSAFARMASRAVAQSASRGRMCHRSRRDDRRWVEAPSCAFVPAHRAASRAFAAVLSKDVSCRQSQGETLIAPHRHASKGGFPYSRSTLSEGLLATRGFPQIREEPIFYLCSAVQLLDIPESFNEPAAERRGPP